MRAFIFPGQGSQYQGMGIKLWESFTEAREVFEEIDESLGQKLSKIMFEGPVESLNLTENTQPALMAVSVAVMRVLQKQGGMDIAKACRFVAGHSLGEYSALTAAGAFSISETAKLLRLRGQSMQKAAPAGTGAMAAILSLPFADVQAAAKEASSAHEICEIANDNSDGQVVISGHKAAVERAAQIATDKGAKRAVMLPVSAPFHCSLMKPAAAVMQAALEGAAMRSPVPAVVSNVTAQAESDTGRIKALLTQQITGMVRWRESVIWMKEQGVSEMVEIGAGKVLAGLVRRIEKDIACESVEEPAQIEALIARLK